MSELNLSRLLATNYETVKHLYPGEGRRKWRLRVAQQFWALSEQEKLQYAQVPPVPPNEAEVAPYTTDDDPLDSVSTDAPGLGILVRTDFSNEQAWQSFLEKLHEAEAEFAADVEVGPTEDDAMDEDEDSGEEDDEEEEESIGGAAQASSSSSSSNPLSNSPPPIFAIVDPTSPTTTPLTRAQLENISNLTALRLFNDVSIRLLPPPHEKRPVARSPPNRLVNLHGWQEVYTGKLVWIYDAKSNSDGCVRVVGQKSSGGVGATGDSWRARVTHIPELQVNLASGALVIDFGGMDRWDYPERVRNLAEAEAPTTSR
ncbi:hypothetical protein BC629DRAFT_1473537, partial [Irpex lacteus]